MEQPKPEFRNNDVVPYRKDDVKVNWRYLGFSYEGSGRILSVLLVGAGLFVISVGAVVFNVWHDYKTGDAHKLLFEAFTLNSCLSLLDPQEKKEFRATGRYCGGAQAEYVRKHFVP